MQTSQASPTLLLPGPARPTPGSRHSPTELPEDLLNQSASRLRTLALLIPDALDQLILSCLAKDRALRPQSAKELSRRLAAIEGADAWTQELARDWWVRHWPIGAARECLRFVMACRDCRARRERRGLDLRSLEWP